MSLRHTTPDQDRLLAKCEAFGGNASAAVEIAVFLDEQLTQANDKIEVLEKELAEVRTELAKSEN